MQDKYGFNLRKCNSADTLSGFIEGDLSKIIIFLPTNNEHVDLFEKTLTGGFSCANTRSSFDAICYQTLKIQIRTIGRIIVTNITTT